MPRKASLLRQAGMRKLNFAGGEPFLYPKFIGELAKHCKADLHIESVSIVTNGSLVKPNFFDSYGQYIDIIAISCDSFNEATNVKIGRGTGKHLHHLQALSKLCCAYGVKFKINTVVNRYNIDENMNESIRLLAPFRWKCFQVLVVPGENDSDATLRNAKRFVITDEEFRKFCEVHSHNECFVAEPNNLMRDSYLVLDEHMRFLDKGNNPSQKFRNVLLDWPEKQLVCVRNKVTLRTTKTSLSQPSRPFIQAEILQPLCIYKRGIGRLFFYRYADLPATSNTPQTSFLSAASTNHTVTSTRLGKFAAF